MWNDKVASLLEEHSDAVRTQLIAILQQQALVHTLLRIRILPVALRFERSDEEGVRRPGDDDIPVALDEFPGFFVPPQRETGEHFEGRC